MALQPLNAASSPTASAVRSERKRIPMSVPVQKLEVRDIPGYHLHWFTNTPERISRALEGGYEYVEQDEVVPNSTSLGSDSAVSGSTDLGTRVSIVAGRELGADGQPVRLILMKIRQEWWDEDQKLIEARNTQVRDALVAGMIGAEQDSPSDRANRYVDTTRTRIPDFFKRKRN